MAPDDENNIADIVENVPSMPDRDADQPAGTVVSADGTHVTLGDEARETKPAQSTNRGTNLLNRKF